MSAFAYPLATLATLLILAVYGAFLGIVSRARTRYGVPAPAVSGHIEFEKRYRVQMNTLEQLIPTLIGLWLTAAWIGDVWAGLGGLAFAFARLLYARGYFAAPEKRATGFTLGLIATSAMLIAPLVAAILHLP